MQESETERQIVPVLPKRVRLNCVETDNIAKRKRAFLILIALGVPVKHAAAHSYLSLQNINNWTQPDSWRFDPEFADQYHAARAEAVVRRVKKMDESTDWRAQAFWLEHSTEEFAPKKATTEASEKPETNAMGGIVMTDEAIAKLSDAHDKMMERLAKKEHAS